MRLFGRLSGGIPVEVATLGSEDGLQAEILTLGGTLRSLSLPVNGRRISLVLVLDDLAAYLDDTLYVGQIIGRYANRITGARFELDGTIYRLSANEGANTLHGGAVGFGRQVWTVVDVAEGRDGHIKLAHRSTAGANGFPGTLDVIALIRVSGNTLSLHFTATTDAPTPINFTWHPYFNLSGDPGKAIAAHRLRLAASRYLPVDRSWLPTGEIATVGDTRFDFRAARPLQAKPTPPYFAVTNAINHYWVLDGMHIAGELYSPESGVGMVCQTSLPGLQVYDGFALRDRYAGKHAVCLEPGNFPDAPNHPGFPSSILRPGTSHRSFMSFSFSTHALAGKSM